MKFLKIVSTLFIAAGFVLTIASCSKKKEDINTVTKDRLVGKWAGNIQSNSGSPAFHAELKGSGAMELDIAPYDGIPDIILLWDVNNNNFTAHLDANGVTNFWKIDAAIDPKTLSMAGQLKVYDPSTPITGIFVMDRQ